MTMYEQIIAVYPELKDSKIFTKDIIIQNDADDRGDWLRVWNYSKPIPEGITLGK
jgi:hypothetical protein